MTNQKRKSKRKKTAAQQHQQYDSSLKTWIAQQAQTLLPLLLPGVTYEDTLTVETIRAPMRMDKVFRVRYHECECILDVEFESSFDAEIGFRLLCYNANLAYDYKLPVITIVLYPFRGQIATSPFCLGTPEETIVNFHFHVIPLFTLDVEEIVRQHHTAMYPLIPTMEKLHTDLIVQVLEELTELYRDDEVTLAQQITWMKLLLERTDMVGEEEKQIMQEKLSLFDYLWETSPTIKKMREEYKMKGLQEGLEKGLEKGLKKGVKTLQDLLVSLVQTKFPELTDYAQQQASHFENLDVLNHLIQKVMTAPDVAAARWLLDGE